MSDGQCNWGQKSYIHHSLYLQREIPVGQRIVKKDLDIKMMATTYRPIILLPQWQSYENQCCQARHKPEAGTQDEAIFSGKITVKYYLEVHQNKPTCHKQSPPPRCKLKARLLASSNPEGICSFVSLFDALILFDV
jgi:hypothetical protein